jgi:membrane protease YdiL (CAAX protease family)
MLLSAAVLGSWFLRFSLSPELGVFIQLREWPTGGTASWISDLALAPLAEEITFRWILYRTVRTRLGVMTSATLSSAIFALLHLADVQSTIIAFWLGFVLATGAERFRNLGVLVATHSGYNCIALMLKTG